MSTINELTAFLNREAAASRGQAPITSPDSNGAPPTKEIPVAY